MPNKLPPATTLGSNPHAGQTLGGIRGAAANREQGRGNSQTAQHMRPPA